MRGTCHDFVLYREHPACFCGNSGRKTGTAIYGDRAAALPDRRKRGGLRQLFGNLFSILYSLAGAMVSFFVMWLTKKRHLSIRPVSVLGGISHNIGQFLVALVLLGTAMWYYLPYLLLVGMVTGLCNGILGQLMYDRRAAFIHSDRK